MNKLNSAIEPRMQQPLRRLSRFIFCDRSTARARRSSETTSTIIDPPDPITSRAGGAPVTTVLARRPALFLFAMCAATTALADWSGDATFETNSLGVAITDDGVFVLGERGFLTPSFRDYVRAALASMHHDERIAIDIDYCRTLPAQFCTPPEPSPPSTEIEKRVFEERFGGLQFMTVGYGGAYQSPDGWKRRLHQSWEIANQPVIFDTRLGRVLFEVDYWLKTWVIGKDPNSGHDLQERIPWLDPLKKYIVDELLHPNGQRHGSGRAWFNLLDSEAYIIDPKGEPQLKDGRVWFPQVRIVLCMAADGLVMTDSPAMTNCDASGPANIAFASGINDHLHELMTAYSVLARMEEAAQAVVAAKWISNKSAGSMVFGPPKRILPTPKTRIKMRLAESDRADLFFPGGVVMDPSVRTNMVSATDDDGTFAAISDAIDQRRPAGASMWIARLSESGNEVRVIRIDV